MAKGRNWTEQEIFRAIELYVRTPFGRLHSRNPEIIRLSEALDRTPGSVAMKLTNLASIDDTIPQKGMANASNLDRETWTKFFNILKNAAVSFSLEPNEPAAGFSAGPQAEFVPSPSAGLDVMRLASTRQGQQYFRQIVLASYNNKCAITGISQKELLVAGHIRKWSDDPENRMNPQNGICLNRLHDRAFEANLLALEDDGKILYSKKLGSVTVDKMRRMNESGFFNFPNKFSPSLEFIREHRAAFRE